MKTLYLVRHTRVNMPSGICYGSTDVELADTFEQELAILKSELKDIIFDRIYSSPLKRCASLAKSLDDNIVIDNRIREFDFGQWERKTWIDIYDLDEGKRWFDDYKNVCTPQGESLQMVLERVKEFIASLPNDFNNILIVTHAGIVRAFMILLDGISIEKAFETPIDYGRVVRIEIN
ncbi:hypothetical protein HW49_07925 [Porphyromonadaceae bacterium COT-184 OH4590]|nr:hypothetical protein HW49_07925 [Porphyromonadaceae bacterium COT-184 OH4590]